MPSTAGCTPPFSWGNEMSRNLLGLTATALALLGAAALGADNSPPQVVNPVGNWQDYEMIIQADMPLRGTLRQVYIDRASGFTARVTGKLPYGGRDETEIQAKVQRGEFPPPRQVQPDTPPGLDHRGPANEEAGTDERARSPNRAGHPRRRLGRRLRMHTEMQVDVLVHEQRVHREVGQEGHDRHP